MPLRGSWRDTARISGASAGLRRASSLGASEGAATRPGLPSRSACSQAYGTRRIERPRPYASFRMRHTES